MINAIPLFYCNSILLCMIFGFAWKLRRRISVTGGRENGMCSRPRHLSFLHWHNYCDLLEEITHLN